MIVYDAMLTFSHHEIASSKRIQSKVSPNASMASQSFHINVSCRVTLLLDDNDDDEKMFIRPTFRTQHNIPRVFIWFRVS